jgi:hypothetical protein
MSDKKYYTRKFEEYEFRTMSEAKEEGYIPYAGPYKKVTEEWMLQNAVVDILRHGRDKYCLVKIGSQVEIWIIPSYYRQGYIHGNDDSSEANTGETSEAITNVQMEAPVAITQG